MGILERTGGGSGLIKTAYKIRLDDFVDDVHHKNILRTFHNRTLIYNPNDVYNTHLTKIKVVPIPTIGAKKLILNHIQKITNS